MRVLVTGASGFIGRVLSQRLTDLGCRVIPVSRSNGTDLTAWQEVQALEPADAVCHLAGVIPRVQEISPREIYLANMIGALHVLEYCRLNGVRAMVLASSYVYGAPQYLPVDEAHPLGGQGPYARSKILAEELARAYGTDHGLSVVALRIFNAYGPGQEGDMLLPTILSQAIKGGEVVLRDPDPRRDFVYVDDIVDAFLAALRDVGAGFRCYNIASGRTVSVREVVRELEDAFGCHLPLRYTGERRSNEIMDCPGSNALIAERLRWSPATPLREGIRRTVEWWKARLTARCEASVPAGPRGMAPPGSACS